MISCSRASTWYFSRFANVATILEISIQETWMFIMSDLTSQRHYYEGLVSVSCSVTIESILGAAKFVALLTVISCASYMLHLNMVLHISCVLACMITIGALPNPRGVLEHLGS
jgi:hypothetical protein